MQFARISVVSCVACLCANILFAQASQIHEESRTEMQPMEKKQPDDKANPKINLRVDDFANLDAHVLAEARKVTTEIFADAGVQTSWLDCPIDHADCGAEAERPQFILRVLGPSMDKEIPADEALGFSIPCHRKDGACLTYIFYQRIKELAAEYHLGPARMLGHVMAHEIGHALLGPNTHEAFSVMQNAFSIHDTERTLYFTSGQSKRLRVELLARKQAPNR